MLVVSVAVALALVGPQLKRDPLDGGTQMHRFTFVLLAALSVLTAACESRRLTGPAAQRAFREAASTRLGTPDGVAIFVNEKALAPGKTLDRLDPTTITNLEVIKVADGPGGVIRISTTDSSLAAELTRP